MARRLVGRRIGAFCVTVGLLSYLAMNGGGYDLVVRQRVGLVIWAVIAVAFAFGLLPRSRPNRAQLLPLILGLALLFWTVMSLNWTESSERTTDEIARLLMYLGLVTLAISSLNRHTFRAAAAGLSVAAVGITVLALLSRLFPSTLGINDVTRIFNTDRLNYPLDYWNAVGAWGAMTVAVCLAWSAHAKSLLLRALSLTAVPAAGVCVYLTYSRGGVIASALAVVAVLTLGRNRWTLLVHALVSSGAAAVGILVVRQHSEIARATGGAGGRVVALTLILGGVACAAAVVFTSTRQLDRLRLPRRVANWAVPCFVTIALVAVLAVGHGAISRQWHDFNSDRSGDSVGSDPATRLTTLAGGNRSPLWGSALDAFSAHPLDGTGPGTFEFWYTRHGEVGYAHDAHSIYLNQLAELGFPGLALLVGFLGGLLAAALRARASIQRPGDMAASIAMTSAFVVFLFSAGIDWMWQETAVGALGLGAAAIAVAGGSQRLQRTGRRGEFAHRGVRTAVVVAAVVAAAVQIPGLVATQRVRDSQSAARAGDLMKSTELAKDAIDAEPWAASPYAQLALVDQRQSRLSEAEREARKAISIEPTNWRWPLVLSSIEAQRGHRLEARRTFMQGRRLFPLSQFYSPDSTYAAEALASRQRRRLR